MVNFSFRHSRISIILKKKNNPLLHSCDEVIDDITYQDDLEMDKLDLHTCGDVEKVQSIFFPN